MEGQSTSTKKTITDWGELIDALAKPARYPQFPELTPEGEWCEWNPEPSSSRQQTLSVEQPPWAKPWPRCSEVTNGVEYHRTLQYTKLPEDCIRLLSLRNAKMDGNVIVGLSLETFAFSAMPTYQAVSYCWGSTNHCTGMLISTLDNGDQICRVTESLATFIHSLLHSNWARQDKPDYVWIDQICIDPDDISERNVQVRRMAEIYQNASQVIVWLGQTSAIDISEINLELSPSAHTQWRGESLLEWVRAWAIFARPWFRRLWVFQEVVLAQQILVLIGTLPLDWETLYNIRDSWARFRKEEDVMGVYPWHRRCNGADIMFPIKYARECMAEGKRMSLPWLLDFLQEGLKCQDPRDKIYGLLGCTEDVLPDFCVDYSRSVASIYEEYTRSLIKTSGNLNVIKSHNRGASQRVPSWVLRFDCTLDVGLEYCLGPTCASNRHGMKQIPRTTEGFLDVSGRLIDTVVAKIDSFHESMATFLSGRQPRPDLQRPIQDTWKHVKNADQSRGRGLGNEHAEDATALDDEARIANQSSTSEPTLPQPCNHFLCTFVDLGHHLDLVVAFLDIQLIDTDGVDP